MTEEIKESIKELEILITALDGTERGEEHNAYTVKCIKNVIDCITNLQQENERLKQLNENASKVCVAEHKYGVEKAEEARDYKSRCEKTNKFIKETPLFEDPFGEGEHAFLGDINTEYYKNLSNILNGSDENE